RHTRFSRDWSSDVCSSDLSPWISGYIGRPRLLRHEDAIYLLGRNWTQPLEKPAAQTAAKPLGFPREQQLCLFRLDDETLTPEARSEERRVGKEGRARRARR